MITRSFRGTILAAVLCAVQAISARAQRQSPAPEPANPALGAASAQVYDAHLHFLTSELLERGAPGSRGADLTARYVASQFEIAGLQPGSTGYFQSVPLKGVTTEPSIILGAGRQTIVLNPAEDFLAWTESADSAINLDADVVFAGYGVEAPEWAWDDYKGMPQNAKIVLVMANDPGLRDSSVFQGAAGVRYARPDFKLAEASKMGAAGILIIHTDGGAGSRWRDLRTVHSGEAVTVDQKDPLAGRVRFAAWIREDAVRAALHASGRDYDLLLRRAQQRDFSPISAGIHAAVDIRTRTRRFRGVNAVTRLGSRSRSGEVVLTARADDASATAMLLTVASALAKSPMLPRSVIFVSTSGRSGEDFFVSDSGSHSDLAGAIAIGSRPSTDTSQRPAVVGGEYSSMGKILANVARTEGTTVGFDSTSDPAFVASGAYPFAVRGVPAIEVSRCRTSVCARLLVRLVLEVASAPARPTWNPGAPFGSRGG